MNRPKAATPQKARTAPLVLAEEIAATEAKLLKALDTQKQARATAERYRTQAGNADAAVDRLRARLAQRIGVFRDLTKGDNIREDVAASWLQDERARHDLPPNPSNGLKAYSIDQALPYAAKLEEQQRAEATG